MPRHVIRQRIERPAAEVFAFIGPNAPENNARYEREVIDWVNVSPRPIQTGTTATMRRVDDGKRHDTHIVCTDYQPGRRTAWRHTDPGPFQFAIAFETIANSQSSTDLVVTIDIALSGPFRLMAPLVRRRMGRNGGEMIGRIKSILETGTGALAPRPEAASA
jgi:hypothetical protein